MPLAPVRAAAAVLRSIADGSFFVRSVVRLAEVTDGTSNTAFMSESILGTGPERTSDSEFREPIAADRVSLHRLGPAQRFELQRRRTMERQQSPRIRLGQRRVPLHAL